MSLDTSILKTGRFPRYLRSLSPGDNCLPLRSGPLAIAQAI
jgi:hypothetical protein